MMKSIVSEVEENGIVKDAENNLKLVAYTLENGDPERIRKVLEEDFYYHSDSSGKDISNVDEYIEFLKYVHSEAVSTYTEYATITDIIEGEEELKYPVGTRCAVVRYEGENQYDAIVFVDTNEEGNIERILLSKEGRYRFSVDNPFPEKEELSELLARANYKSSIIGRAHFHDLIIKEMDEERIDSYIDENSFPLEMDLNDLFDREISEEVFAEAFLRGVQKSEVKGYNVEDIRKIGRQFHKDATLFKSEEEQKETFHDALILVAAIGQLYIGRWDERENKSEE